VLERQPDGFRREAAPVPPPSDRVAEVGVLEDAAHDLVERDSPDEVVAAEHAERVATVRGLVGEGGLDVRELGPQGEPAPVADRLPFRQELAVLDRVRERGRSVVLAEQPQADLVTRGIHARYCRPVTATKHDAVVELLRRDLEPGEYDEIRELWKRHSIAEDERDLPGLISTLTEECVYELVQTGDRWEGHEGAARFYTQLLSAFPDIKFDLTHIVIGPQGVCEEAEVTATHQGEWLGRAPTGERVEFKVVIFFPWNRERRLFDGERVYFDADDALAGNSR
jgi:predicted ester cyclase